MSIRKGNTVRILLAIIIIMLAGACIYYYARSINTQAAELETLMQSLATEFDTVDKERAKAELAVKKLQSARDEQAQALAVEQNKSANVQSEFFAGMQALLKLRNELHSLEQAQELRMRKREEIGRAHV